MPGKLKTDNGVLVDCVIDGTAAGHTVGAYTTVLWVLHLRASQFVQPKLNQMVNYMLHDDDGVDKQVVGKVVKCAMCKMHGDCVELHLQS